MDNLPTTLIPTFAELCAHSTRRIARIALGVDIREREYLHPVVEVLGELRGAGYHTEVLFLEASEEALVRRYHETRRRHPVSSGSLLDGIREERKLLANLRELADRVIDTSQITVHELRQRLVELYGEAAAPGLSVNLLSFGYKFGVPYEADLVFDCRFLPNPFFVDALKAQDGRTAGRAPVRGRAARGPGAASRGCATSSATSCRTTRGRARPTSRWRSAAPAAATARSRWWRSCANSSRRTASRST